MTTTLEAAPCPLLVTVMVNPARSPTLTTAASAVFVIASWGEVTTIAAEAESEAGALLELATVAVSTIEAAVAVVVGPPTCMTTEAPAASEPMTSVSRPLEMTAPGVVVAQATSLERGSVTTTLEAAPCPLLVTVMVNPARSPTLTTAASAVFVIARSGRGRVTRLVSSVTAPFLARARPLWRLAPVVRVMLVRATMFPSNAVPVPMVAELPTWK